MNVGLRIDADTFRGTKYGVPNLIRLLGEHGASASFFFSLGPDNMGRHLLRLIRPSFLGKMLRSKAPNLYGWDIILKGTLWPGPVIGEKLQGIIRSASDAGHEVGLHAWDHHAWQVRADRMGAGFISGALQKAFDLLSRILGRPPACSAVPGWKCNDLTLIEKSKFPFRYNSDCRGVSIFYPLIHETVMSQPQIPVTLPTYDEVVGRNGICDGNYNAYMLSLLDPEKLNVLTVHAEVEGLGRLSLFERFMKEACLNGTTFSPLGTFLGPHTGIGRAPVVKTTIDGREGWVSSQRVGGVRRGIGS